MLTGELSTPVRMSGEIYRGTGVSDYNDLDNKPSINGVELVGNKTTEQLGIQTVVNIEYNTPFDTGKRLNGKIVYGYYGKSTPILRANWNDATRELTGLPINITPLFWDVKLLTNNGVHWQQATSNDSIYIIFNNTNYVTAYWTYNGANTAIAYTYIEYTLNE